MNKKIQKIRTANLKRAIGKETATFISNVLFLVMFVSLAMGLLLSNKLLMWLTAILCILFIVSVHAEQNLKSIFLSSKSFISHQNKRNK